jgi:hypothetical protein
MRSPQLTIRRGIAAGLVALCASAAAPSPQDKPTPRPGRPVRGPAPATPAPAAEVVAANRLLIRFAGGAFSLVERKEVRKAIPPSDELPSVEGPLSGFWYELRSAEGQVRYRRIIDDPVRLVFEGPEDPKTPLPAVPQRSEGIPAERFFSLIIPAAQQGDQLVLFSSPLRLGAQGEPAAEVARLDLFPIVIN